MLIPSKSSIASPTLPSLTAPSLFSAAFQTQLLAPLVFAQPLPDHESSDQHRQPCFPRLESPEALELLCQLSCYSEAEARTVDFTDMVVKFMSKVAVEGSKPEVVEASSIVPLAKRIHWRWHTSQLSK